MMNDELGVYEGLNYTKKLKFPKKFIEI
jgi:hypothetical protein